MGQVTKVRLSCYLDLLSSYSETRQQDSRTFVTWPICLSMIVRSLNTLRPRQDGRHFPDDILICIFSNENEWHSIKISLTFVTNVPINNIPALVQIMAWRRPGDKPLSEPIMVVLPTHICVTRPQWVKLYTSDKLSFYWIPSYYWSLWHQAITRTHVHFLSSGSLGTNVHRIEIKSYYSFWKLNAFENVVCNIALLFRLSCFTLN